MMINQLFNNAKSWPFEEAKRVFIRTQQQKPQKGYVLFDTGYGPSGLPHIGTFGEVLRTSMIRYAFSLLSDLPTRLFAFSDDMDGFRKVPDNVPNQDMLRQHIGKPLTKVPDPFGLHESFGHHNNARLQSFLDSFGFDYEFQSSTDWYTSGRFDETLIEVFQHYDEIMALMLPTLRDERRATYSPFLPICPRTGNVLQVKIDELKADSHTVVYKDPELGHYVEVPVTKGHCKLQWKADLGMRWRAFDVDYEMAGKDLTDSIKLSGQICRILGGRAPESMIYELFLDKSGQKISKSKGNGLSIEEWLTYAPKESLAYYMFQSPRKAKRLHFDVIPKAVDEYATYLQKFFEQENEAGYDNPVFHVHQGQPPEFEKTGITFNILLNLVSVCNAEDEGILFGFVQKYVPDCSETSKQHLKNLIHYALHYYRDFVAPYKTYRRPSEAEREALLDLEKTLQAIDSKASSERLQNIVFEVGKRHQFEDLKVWFQTLYEVLLGQKEGPRMGSFIALYGLENICQLIREKLG